MSKQPDTEMEEPGYDNVAQRSDLRPVHMMLSPPPIPEVRQLHNAIRDVLVHLYQSLYLG